MTKSNLQTKTRIGKISYANCLPFYHGFAQDSMDFLEAHPAQINRAIHAGELDIAPVSSLEYLLHQDDYLLLPNLAIGARKFSGSVLLLSHEKIENLNHQKILLTEQSLSSSTLLKILLKAKFHFENEFSLAPSDPEQMLKQEKAALVIGNDALFYEPESMVYKYDLAQLWQEWTGKPFCFALWVTRREYAENHQEEVFALCQRLQRIKIQNLQRIEALIHEELSVFPSDPRHPKLLSYLSSLCYDLDPWMKEGVAHYFDLANQWELAPKPKPLNFIGGEC